MLFRSQLSPFSISSSTVPPRNEVMRSTPLGAARASSSSRLAPPVSSAPAAGASCAAAVDAATDRYGRLDTLVNNVAVTVGGIRIKRSRLQRSLTTDSGRSRFWGCCS